MIVSVFLVYSVCSPGIPSYFSCAFTIVQTLTLFWTFLIDCEVAWEAFLLYLAPGYIPYLTNIYITRTHNKLKF